MQPPNIDNRAFPELVAQAETLVQIATNNQWRSGDSEYVAVEALAGRVLDQDMYAQVLPAGVRIDQALAAQLNAAPGMCSVALADANDATIRQDVALPDDNLAGRMLAADLLVWVSGDQPTFFEQRVVLSRGTCVTHEHVERLLAIAATQPVRVRARPPAAASDMGSALIRVFGRFAELAVSRLNQVPEKHFLSFLNLIGVGLLPPRPARAPLLFRLVTGSPVDAVVPAGTRIAAPPASGEEGETVFETERDLVVTRTQLVEAYTRSVTYDTAGDAYRDCYHHATEQIKGLTPEPFDAFLGERVMEHELYLACDALLRLPAPADIAVDLTTPDAAHFPNLPLAWSYWNGSVWQPVPTSWANWSFRRNYEWQPLAQEHELPSEQDASVCRVVLRGIPPLAETTVDGVRGGWLRASLQSPLFAAQQQFAPDYSARNDERPLAADLPATILAGAGATRTFYLSSVKGFGIVDAMVALEIGFQQPGVSDDVELTWEYQTGDGTWQELGRSAVGRESIGANAFAFTDGTRALTMSGQVRFRIPADLSGIETRHQERTGRWLRFSVSAGTYREPPTVLSMSIGTTAASPRIDRITHSVLTPAPARPPRMAFSDTAALDVSKDVLPFGDAPGPGSTFYVAYGVAYELGAQPGSLMNIGFELRGGSPGGKANDGRVTLRWEYWNGNDWITLWSFTTSGDDEVERIQGPVYYDTTRALALGATAQPPRFVPVGVGFTLPADAQPCPVNGVSDYWVRVRIVEGGYGSPATYRTVTKDFGGAKLQVYELDEATYRPPALRNLQIGVQPAAERPISACISYNDFEYRHHSAALAGDGVFAPFRPTTDKDPALYLGFDGSFDQRLVTLYAEVVAPRSGEVSVANLGTLPAPRPQLAWEYATGPADRWAPLDVSDETSALASRGLIQFVGPPDFARRERFGASLYWLRARVHTGAFKVMPRLQRLATNTMWATQAVTVHNEIPGSGTGSAGLVVRLAQRPVLPGLQLDVREPELLSDDQTPTGEEEGWVCWQAVADFHSSGPHDRHYLVDSQSGEIRFGDGIYGMAPPLGQNNIRATYYQSGGGLAGNRPVNAIVELKTSVPYVDGVTNIEAASGGADRQSLESAKRYGPRVLRHRGRAVTADDIEDLAYAASADVARARAVTPRFKPLDLDVDPQHPDTIQRLEQAGTVGVIIVPQDGGPQPTPSLGLLEDVRSYLQARCGAGVRLWVAGPDWIEVVIRATVAATSLRDADALRARVLTALEQYLHPLTGGSRGVGWEFGRTPYPSEMYALLKGVAGLDHVRELEVTTPSLSGAVQPTSLIYSGTHQIRLVER
jgi:hypothetical protein